MKPAAPRLSSSASALAASLLLACASACGSSGPSASAGDEALVSSDLPRKAPDLDPAALAEQVRANTAFGIDLYQLLRAEADDDDNLFLSPFSVSIALAMTHAGARGDTAAQLAEALRLVLADDGHHAAFNALEQALSARPGEVEDEDALRLSLANALWAQKGYPVEDPFLDTLAEHYGSGLRLLDFQREPEPSRVVINDWVSARTEEKIPELLPEGSVEATTRFVLTNAIYLKADWLFPFEEEATGDRPFTRLDGTEIQVERMHQDARLPYAAGDGFQAVVMPYVGESLSMVFLVPDRGRFEELEAALDVDFLDAMLDSAEAKQVGLGLPRFEFSSDFDLIPSFAALGVVDAFEPGLSDFSGMDGGADPRLHISGIFHEGFVAVDEEGTEAAAATGVVVGTDSAGPDIDVTLHIDRPFLFLIRDAPTGTVLFLGRVLDPSAD